MAHLLKEQYKRNEKARLKNKQEERKMVHEIESRNGIRALHEYRIEMVNREQRKIAKELEKIREGLRRHKHRLSVGVQGRTPHAGFVHPLATARAGLSPTHKSYKQISPRPLVAAIKPKHVTGSRSGSMQVGHVRGSVTERQIRGSVTERRTSNQSKEAGRGNKHDRSPGYIDKSDDDSDDDSNDDYDDNDSSVGEARNGMPDPEVLKAILKGVVNCWEETVVLAAEATYTQGGGVMTSPQFPGLVGSPEDKCTFGVSASSKRMQGADQEAVGQDVSRAASVSKKRSIVQLTDTSARGTGSRKESVRSTQQLTSHSERKNASRASSKLSVDRGRPISMTPSEESQAGLHGSKVSYHNRSSPHVGKTIYSSGDKEGKLAGGSYKLNYSSSQENLATRRQRVTRKSLDMTHISDIPSSQSATAGGDESRTTQEFVETGALQSSGQIYTRDLSGLTSTQMPDTAKLSTDKKPQLAAYSSDHQLTGDNIQLYNEAGGKGNIPSDTGGSVAVTHKPSSLKSGHSERTHTGRLTISDLQPHSPQPNLSLSSTPRLPKILPTKQSGSTNRRDNVTRNNNNNNNNNNNEDDNPVIFYKNPKLHIYHGSVGTKSPSVPTQGRQAEDHPSTLHLGDTEHSDQDSYSETGSVKTARKLRRSRAGERGNESKTKSGASGRRVVERTSVDRDATPSKSHEETQGRRYSRHARIEPIGPS